MPIFAYFSHISSPLECALLGCVNRQRQTDSMQNKNMCGSKYFTTLVFLHMYFLTAMRSTYCVFLILSFTFDSSVERQSENSRGQTGRRPGASQAPHTPLVLPSLAGAGAVDASCGGCHSAVLWMHLLSCCCPRILFLCGFSIFFLAVCM